MGDETPTPYPPDREQAIHARALARARAERGDRPGPQRLSGTALAEEMERRGRRNAAVRAEVRADLGDTSWEDRRDAQVRRVNAQHALLPLIQRFEDYLPAQLSVPEVVEWAAGAAAGDDDWLVILGPTGVGKTWQAVGAYKAVTHDRGAEGQAIGCTELFARSLPSAPDRLDLRPYEDADVLLLDDLTGELSDWDRKVLFRLIDARSARNRLTVVTSNLTAERVRPVLGARLASRLSHRLRLVEMEGPDRRLRADDAPDEEPVQRLPYKD
jgi:chromosomal replication initiation ATPase DnaA